MGIDANLFGMEAALLGMIVSLQKWPFLVLLPILHALARWAFARDEQMVVAAMKYSKEPDLWDPWHHPRVVDARARGFGKGLPL